MAELVDATDLKSVVARRVGSSPTTRIMTKNQRIAALVLETAFIVLFLLDYFTTTNHFYRGLDLGLAIFFMCLFILDWSALMNNKKGG